MPNKQNDQLAALLQANQFKQALELSSSLINTGKADAEVWCMSAIANGHLGLYEDSENSAKKAIKLAPQYSYAYLIRGIALVNLGKNEDAIHCFKKLLKLQPDNYEACKNIGRSFHNLKKLDKAISYYEKALKLNNNDSELVFYLCDALERNHQEDKLERALKAGLDKYPNHPGITLIAAKNEKYNNDYVAAEKRLFNAINHNNDIPGDIYTMLANELAHIYDRQGKYDKAFDMFNKGQVANEKLASGKYDRSVYFNRMSRIKQVITKDAVQQWKSSVKDDKKAPIFLVGFPRSGTTLMERILSSHPAIYTSDEQDTINNLIKEYSIKKNNYNYPDNIIDISKNDIKKLREQYWKSVEKITGKQSGKHYYLDKLPLNLIELGFIKRIFPDSPIIFVKRDPRDSCLSCFMQLFGNNEAMIHFSSMDSTARFYAEVMGLWEHYKDVLDMHYFEYKYEDLVDNMEAVLRELLKFLDIEWNDAILTYHQKKNVKFSSTPSYQDITKPIYKRAKGRWLNYKDNISTALDILQPYVKRFDYD